MTATKSGVFTAIAIVCLGAAPTLRADARPNPYLSIVDRNPFGIKPPLPPTAVEQPQVMAPLAKVVLTGVENMFGKPRALLEITESEPGKGPVVNKRILREGERDGSVEVLAIDVANSSVRIKNGPVETNVVFEVAKAGPGALPTQPTQFVPPSPMGAMTHPNPGMGMAPGAPNTGSSPYIVTPGGTAGRSGSGVTLMGASTPATTTPPGVPPPGSFPNLAAPPVPSPTQPNYGSTTPGVTQYGAPAGAAPNYNVTPTDGKQLPLRNMRTDLLDPSKPRALQYPPAK